MRHVLKDFFLQISVLDEKTSRYLEQMSPKDMEGDQAGCSKEVDVHDSHLNFPI